MVSCKPQGADTPSLTLQSKGDSQRERETEGGTEKEETETKRRDRDKERRRDRDRKAGRVRKTDKCPHRQVGVRFGLEYRT